MNSDVKYQTKSLILSSIIISLGMFFSAYYFKNNPNSNETVKGVSELNQIYPHGNYQYQIVVVI